LPLNWATHLKRATFAGACRHTISPSLEPNCLRLWFCTRRVMTILLQFTDVIWVAHGEPFCVPAAVIPTGTVVSFRTGDTRVPDQFPNLRVFDRIRTKNEGWKPVRGLARIKYNKNARAEQHGLAATRGLKASASAWRTGDGRPCMHAHARSLPYRYKGAPTLRLPPTSPSGTARTISERDGWRHLLCCAALHTAHGARIPTHTAHRTRRATCSILLLPACGGLPMPDGISRVRLRRLPPTLPPRRGTGIPPLLPARPHLPVSCPFSRVPALASIAVPIPTLLKNRAHPSSILAGHCR